MTVGTLASVSPNMRLIDVNGLPHELTELQVWMMITIGWLTFIAAWVMNICFYKTHPSSVDFSPKRFTEKMFIYIFGKKYSLSCSLCSCCSKGEAKNQTKSNNSDKKFFLLTGEPKQGEIALEMEREGHKEDVGIGND